MCRLGGIHLFAENGVGRFCDWRRFVSIASRRHWDWAGRIGYHVGRSMHIKALRGLSLPALQEPSWKAQIKSCRGGTDGNGLPAMQGQDPP
jgi:hypothetical protein